MLQTVEEFSSRERWNQLSDPDIENIATSYCHILSTPPQRTK
ncbi:hypothetical protein [Anabaena sp. PCC 7108]|nr:hypothetical protein [Anabaena sp. PCC 7108]